MVGNEVYAIFYDGKPLHQYLRDTQIETYANTEPKLYFSAHKAEVAVTQSAVRPLKREKFSIVQYQKVGVVG